MVKCNFVFVSGLCLLFFFVHCNRCISTMCKLPKNSVPAMIMNGDVIIGGIFPIHRTDGFRDLSFTIEPSYQWVQSMIFAINEINKNEDLLPNLSLGYAIYDTCNSITRAVEQMFALITGSDVYVPNYQCYINSSLAAVIGESSSTISISMATILGIYQYPQISYFSSLPALSNKKEFPSFLRTIPSDTFQSKAFAYLVKHFDWKWVGTLAEDIEYGIQGVQLFREEVEKYGVCIAFAEKVPLTFSRATYQQIAETIKSSNAKVIVVFSGDSNLLPLVEEIAKQNITGITWLASEAWSTATYILKENQIKHFEGTLGFAITKSHIPGLHEFLVGLHPFNEPQDMFIKELWENIFECLWNPGVKHDRRECTGVENLAELTSTFLDTSELRITSNVYNAVYAIAHALHNLESCEEGRGPFKEGRCADIHAFEPSQLLHYLKRMQFLDKAGNIQYFDENGDTVAKYDLVNWQRGTDGSVVVKTVGRYDGSKLGVELEINMEAIYWNGGCFTIHYEKLPGKVAKRRDHCVPKDSEFLSFGESLGIILTVLALIGTLVTFSIIMIFLKYMKTPIVRANNLELSFLLLFSLLLCFLCALTFMGEPSMQMCIMRQTGFAISFVLSISCILVKTLVVLLAFKMTLPNQNAMKRFRPLHQRLIIITTTLVQIGICVGFMVSSPPSVNRNRDTVISKIILECNEGPELALFCILGYIGFLAVINFVLAFLARNLPDNFNEAKFITFSLLVFVVVWISFIPGYISTKGKYLIAVEIFAILSSSFGLLVCIFFPKCYIILLKPEMNTKNSLMGRPNKH
uniref:Vomeronasal type-2 receptor 1-like n=1 Tax=Erpetoichthys calabaricus TaxID=27687 RepID=A0A8C4SCR0_ERPCA